MVFEQKDTIGIVISDEMILVSRCGRNAAGKKTIANFISVNVPQGMIQNGFISDTKGFSRLLKGIFKDNGIKSRKINVAIQESSTIIHLAKLAKLPEEEFKQLLEDEVSKYMAYGEVPVIGHYSIGHGDTVIIAIRKSIVKALLEATDKAGLEVIGVDIPSMAVLRTLIHDGNIDLNKDKSVAVILCGNKTSMLIVKDGMPSYFRTLSATDIEELAKEVRITTAYWEEQYPERGIDKTIILGDTSKAKELDMELSDEGGVVESSGIIPDKFDLMRSASAGLALRNEKNRSIFDVNLLPEERFIRLRLEKLLLTSVIIIGLIALVSLSVSSVFSLGIISYEKKIEVINKKAETQPRILPLAEEINVKKLKAIEKVERLETFMAGVENIPWTGILEDIRRFIPHDVWITELLSKKTNVVTIKGRAFNPDAVYKYVRLLGFCEYFHAPELSFLGAKKEEGDTCEFIIVCPLI